MENSFTAQSVALVANGAIHNLHLIADLIKSYERVVAVDGGLSYCHQMHIPPDMIIGDFDSAPAELLNHYLDVPSKKFPIDKDDTDLELAIHAINTPITKKIGIFGALGNRTDHTLYNLHLMCRFANKIVIETETESVFTLSGKSEISCRQGQGISLISFGMPAKGVKTKGLKWEIKEGTFDMNFSSISNICLSSQAIIEISEGQLICCLSRI